MPPKLTVTAASANQILLEWEEPFTWPGYNISGYSVQVVTSSGVIESLVQTTLSRSHLYSVVDSSEQEGECVPLTFKVSAVSELGASQAANVTTGLPKGEYVHCGICWLFPVNDIWSVMAIAFDLRVAKVILFLVLLIMV